MCAILNVMPEEILSEPADVELVKALIAAEKPTAPEGGELDTDMKELLELVRTSTEEERRKILEIVRVMKGVQRGGGND